MKTAKHFSCDSCDIKFMQFSDWQKHRNEDTSCKALTCPNCGKNFQGAKAGYKESEKFYTSKYSCLTF